MSARCARNSNAIRTQFLRDSYAIRTQLLRDSSAFERDSCALVESPVVHRKVKNLPLRLQQPSPLHSRTKMRQRMTQQLTYQRTLPSAFKIFCGVIGCEWTATEKVVNASLIAFITAAGAPAVPASPAPFAPSSELVVGVCTCAI